MVRPDGGDDDDTTTTTAADTTADSTTSTFALKLQQQQQQPEPANNAGSNSSKPSPKAPPSKGYAYLFKYVLVGDSWSGKTALVRRFAENAFVESQDVTIGVDFAIKTQDMDNGDQVKLQLWDTAGQERYRTITTSYYRGCNAIIIVYDVNDQDSYDHVQNWLQEVDRYCNDDTKIVIVGSKLDKAESSPSSEPIAGRERMLKEEWIQNKEALLGVFEVSAKSGQGVHEAFDVITRALVSEKLDQRNPLRAGGVIKLGAQGGGGGSNSGGQGKKKCC